MNTKILYSKEKKKHMWEKKMVELTCRNKDIWSAGWKNENDDPLKYNNIKDDKDSL